jgi:hypothetical protein
MKTYFFLFLLFLSSCNEKFTSKLIGTSECYIEYKSINKKYNNEIVVFDVCVVSKGLISKTYLNTQFTTTKDSFLIKKAKQNILKYFYSIPYPDEKYPNRCGKIRVKFANKIE